MKYIKKGAPPRELTDWFRHQPIVSGQRINCGYDVMPADVRLAVKQSLLIDQGWICCYTGMRVNHSCAHIEHFKPQVQCEDHEDIDYSNLLAAYPGVNMPKCQYGAHQKDNWYDPPNMVTPLHRSCESQFSYKLDGSITPNSQAAQITITHLRLDNASLTEMRAQAIRRVLRTRQLSRAQIERVSQSYSVRDHNGQFPIFCFVIQQAAQELLHKADHERVRREESRRQIHK
jgi:uncharacterized protein (TIGR02646 family)